MTKEKKSWRIVETIPENDDVTSLVIETEDGSPMHHKPGQFASIRVMTDEGWSDAHPFTISCDAHDNRLRFTVKSIGDFTAQVRKLNAGTEVQCSDPLGVFCKDIENQENIVMIAGGVGITPFLSVLRTFRTDKARNKVMLFWSNKTLADAFAEQELIEISKELDLTVVFLLTREKHIPDPPEGGRVFYHEGRLEKDMLEEYNVAPTASFYVCGPPAMQEAVLQMLQSCGISQERVQKEAFTFKK